MIDPAQEVEILLVEDSPTGAEPALQALKKGHLANKLVWAKDGAEALDYVFCSCAYFERNIVNRPKAIFLDLQMPKVNGLEGPRRIEAAMVTLTGIAAPDCAKPGAPVGEGG